ncbi:hypothetical protein DERP_010492 [Dermatophagoides pteronyssinus]|uniref:Uncharacterized protein n=1 Tax=Dermatophagoides pteronyssinus TaxID=6956 RepID=A0ABQ8JFE9_DERPT|nr:hypothetical protein DERP_010492 [Dermatophagoides pteronyssinus]
MDRQHQLVESFIMLKKMHSDGDRKQKYRSFLVYFNVSISSEKNDLIERYDPMGRQYNSEEEEKKILMIKIS